MARTDKGFIAASWTADSTGSSGWLGEGAETKLARYWDPRTPVDAAATPLLDINFSSSLLAHPLSGVTSYATALKSLRGPFTPKHQPNGQYLLIFYNNNAARDPSVMPVLLNYRAVMVVPCKFLTRPMSPSLVVAGTFCRQALNQKQTGKFCGDNLNLDSMTACMLAQQLEATLILSVACKVEEHTSPSPKKVGFTTHMPCGCMCDW